MMQRKYDIDSFDKELADYASIEIEYLDADINVRTAALAKGYDAVCAFVSSDLSAPVLEVLHEEGVGSDPITLCRFQQCGSGKGKGTGTHRPSRTGLFPRKPWQSMQ